MGKFSSQKKKKMFAALSQYEERFTKMEERADDVKIMLEKIDRVVGQLLLNIQVMNAAMQTLLKAEEAQIPKIPTIPKSQ